MMSEVNENCYVHYYIQQQNTSIAMDTFLSTSLLRRQNNGGLLQLTQGGSKVRRPCQTTILGATFVHVMSHRQEAENGLIWKGDIIFRD